MSSPSFRSVTPKARLIRLTDPFLNYLRADGIILPPDTIRPNLADDDSGVDTFSDDDEEESDPSAEWREIHAQIKATIAELGGKVTPKLNWSSPKDATWMSATNDLECRSPNDIYLLLKSSDFVTHDLEHAFDDCVDEPSAGATLSEPTLSQAGPVLETSAPVAGDEAITDVPSKPLQQADIPYHLVLRKYINLNPALEFRCFVKNKKLIGICQRDLNHFEFLFQMRDDLRARIESFFDQNLKRKFPDPSFVFDVYIPPPHERVWLVDINPWALRTDPLIFSWMELLTMEVPEVDDDSEIPSVRFRFHIGGAEDDTKKGEVPEEEDEEEQSDDDSDDDTIDLPFIPELRLVGRDDPEAHGFSSRNYSAHKIPRDVVDASRGGPGGLSEFMGQWKDVLEKKVQEDEEYESDDSETENAGTVSGAPS